MSQSTIQEMPSESADVESRRALVERVAASDLFQKAHRLREFLLYAADCTLENRLADVREQAIAERVFGRRPEFQGAEDSIVRAEARNLRKRLDTYFNTEGKFEPVLIVMPKGGYSLGFERRLLETKAEIPPVIQNPAFVWPPWLGLTTMLVAVAAVALAVYWHDSASRLRSQFHIASPTLPFSALFSQDQDTFIITSDTGLLQISSLARRRITLDEYMARSYPEVPNTQPTDLIRNWNVYEFTDGREMAIAGLIMRSNAQYAQHIDLRSGHEVQLQDFKDHNTVLIGSPVSNPWAQLYEDKLNFGCELDSQGRIGFRNKAARGSELSQYPSPDDILHNRTYARLAFLPRGFRHRIDPSDCRHDSSIDTSGRRTPCRSAAPERDPTLYQREPYRSAALL